MYDGLLNHIKHTNVPSTYIRKSHGATWLYALILGTGVGLILGQML